MSEEERKMYSGGRPNEYEFPEDKTHFIDTEKGEVVKDKNLTPWQIIKLTAQEIGAKIKDPRNNCKHCYGRGYVGFNANTKEPVPCRCIYLKEDIDENDLKGTQMNISRKQKREYIRYMKREAKKKKKKEILKRKKEKIINRLPTGKLKIKKVLTKKEGIINEGKR